MVKTYDCTSGGVQWCQGCYTMEEQPDFLGKRQGEWVSLEDYEKIEAALREAYQISHYGRGSMQDIDDVLERAIRQPERAVSSLCAVCDQIKELHPATHHWTPRATDNPEGKL